MIFRYTADGGTVTDALFNVQTSGYTPEEAAELARWLNDRYNGYQLTDRAVRHRIATYDQVSRNYSAVVLPGS